MTAPAVSAVVLAFRDEPWLERCVHALLDSTGVEVDVVLVDNGCTDGAVERLAQTPGVAVVRPGENLGFAGGCNAGAAVASGEFLALINGDLVVEAEALSELVAFAAKPGDEDDDSGGESTNLTSGAARQQFAGRRPRAGSPVAAFGNLNHRGPAAPSAQAV